MHSLRSLWIYRIEQSFKPQQNFLSNNKQREKEIRKGTIDLKSLCHFKSCLCSTASCSNVNEQYIEIIPIETRTYVTVERRMSSMRHSMHETKRMRNEGKKCDSDSYGIDWSHVPKEPTFRTLFLNQILLPSLSRQNEDWIKNINWNHDTKKNSLTFLHDSLWPHGHLSGLILHNEQTTMDFSSPSVQCYLFPLIYSIRKEFCVIALPFIEDIDFNSISCYDCAVNEDFHLQHPEISYCHQIVDELGMVIEQLFRNGLPISSSVSSDTKDFTNLDPYQFRSSIINQTLILKHSLSLLIPFGSMIVSDPIRMRCLIWEIMNSTLKSSATEPLRTELIKSKSIDEISNSLQQQFPSLNQSVTVQLKRSSISSLLWDINKQHKLFNYLVDCNKKQNRSCPNDEGTLIESTNFEYATVPSRTNSHPYPIHCPFVFPWPIYHQIQDTRFDRFPNTVLYTAECKSLDKLTSSPEKTITENMSKTLSSKPTLSNGVLFQHQLNHSDQTQSFSMSQSRTLFPSILQEKPSGQYHHIVGLHLTRFPCQRLPYTTPTYTSVSFQEFLRSHYNHRNMSESQIAALILRHPGAKIVCLHSSFKNSKFFKWLIGINNLEVQSEDQTRKSRLHASSELHRSTTISLGTNVWNFHQQSNQRPIQPSLNIQVPFLPEQPVYRLAATETITIVDSTPWFNQSLPSTIHSQKNPGFFFRITGSFRCLATSSTPTSGVLILSFHFKSQSLQQWAHIDWLLSPLASWENSPTPLNSLCLNSISPKRLQNPSLDLPPSKSPSTTSTLSIVPASTAFTVFTYQLQCVPSILPILPILAKFEMTVTPTSVQSHSILHISIILDILRHHWNQFKSLQIRLPLLQPSTCMLSQHFLVPRQLHGLTATIGTIKSVNLGRVILWDIDPSEMKSYIRTLESSMDHSISSTSDSSDENRLRITMCGIIEVNHPDTPSLSPILQDDPDNCIWDNRLSRISSMYELNAFMESTDQDSGRKSYHQRMPPLLPLSLDRLSLHSYLESVIQRSFIDLTYSLLNYSVTGLNLPTMAIVTGTSDHEIYEQCVFHSCTMSHYSPIGYLYHRKLLPATSASSICHSNKHIIANSTPRT